MYLFEKNMINIVITYLLIYEIQTNNFNIFGNTKSMFIFR